MINLPSCTTYGSCSTHCLLWWKELHCTTSLAHNGLFLNSLEWCDWESPTAWEIEQFGQTAEVFAWFFFRNQNRYSAWERRLWNRNKMFQVRMLITGKRHHSCRCSEFLSKLEPVIWNVVGVGSFSHGWCPQELNPFQLKCLHNAKYCQKGNPKFQISGYFES